MSIPLIPRPAKLIIGVFLKDKYLAESLAGQLSKRFGKIDTVSSWLPFSTTGYYESEMGMPLYRRLFSFEKLIAQDDLAGIKLITNGIEDSYSSERGRRINIDPGFMTDARFVLATGKEFAHRIHIGRGIYAELTLTFSGGGFNILPWTYPDYATSQMTGLLLKIREKYMMDVKKSGFSAEPAHLVS